MVVESKNQGLCPECPDRAGCARACAELEQELDQVTGYQRENLLSPLTLELLWEKPAVPPEVDKESHLPQVELSRRRVRSLLTRRQARVLELMFWEGKNLAEAADRLGIHRSAALRRYRNALDKLRFLLLPPDPHY